MTKTEKEISKFLDESLNKYINEYQRSRFVLESTSDYCRGKVRVTDDIIDGINKIIDNNELRNDLWYKSTSKSNNI